MTSSDEARVKHVLYISAFGSSWTSSIFVISFFFFFVASQQLNSYDMSFVFSPGNFWTNSILLMKLVMIMLWTRSSDRYELVTSSIYGILNGDNSKVQLQ